MAASYDPDPDAPLGFRLPVDLETGELLPARWKRWQKHDPIHLVGKYRDNLRTLRGIYIDCGWRDQYHLHFGARILSRELAAARHQAHVRGVRRHAFVDRLPDGREPAVPLPGAEALRSAAMTLPAVSPSSDGASPGRCCWRRCFCSPRPPPATAPRSPRRRRTSTTRPDWRRSRSATGSAPIDNLNVALVAEPTNADLQNCWATPTGTRAGTTRAFEHYRAALQLDPKHRGAHEYIGETYLLTGNKAKAREHLAALERICGKKCDEYQDLQKAIASAKYRSTGGTDMRWGDMRRSDNVEDVTGGSRPAAAFPSAAA